MCGCSQQAALKRTGTQAATISGLIYVSYLEHLRPNLSDLIEKKSYNERTHKISRSLFQKPLKKQV